MKIPWSGKTGLARAIAITATVLALSVGLCGVNIVAYIATNTPLEGNGYFLQKTAVVEIDLIKVFSVGLLFLVLIGAGRALLLWFRRRK